MRIGFVPVIAVASLWKSQFQDFAEFLEETHRLVDCGQTGRGEIPFHLFIEVFNARVTVAQRQNFEDGNPLGSDAEISLSEGFYHFFQAGSLHFYFLCPQR